MRMSRINQSVKNMSERKVLQKKTTNKGHTLPAGALDLLKKKKTHKTHINKRAFWLMVNGKPKDVSLRA
jgi:hypothetical protein